jgi:hypothetical protein
MTVTDSLDSASKRIAAGKLAGSEYEATLAQIKDNLTSSSGITNKKGQSLGTMVATQLEMTEAETKYQIMKGIPSGASKAAKDAAGGVSKAAGG